MRNQTIKKDPNNRGLSELISLVRSIWLGMRDSNPRMPVPKTGALPLGDALIRWGNVTSFINFDYSCKFYPKTTDKTISISLYERGTLQVYLSISMRIVEPHEFKGVKHPSKRRRRFRLKGVRIFLLIVLLSYIGASLARPISAITASVQIPLASKAQQVSFVWPTYGQAAAGAVGYGVLGTNGEQRPLPIASVAKVMTALAVLKAKPLPQGQSGPMITITQEDVDYYYRTVAEGGSNTAVVLGEEISQYQALQALLLPSSNNMAFTLARWAYGSEEEYTNFANNFAKSLGMMNSTFADASGFSAETVSTATDLTKLAVNAMDNPVIAEIAAQVEADIPVAGRIYNVNSLLGENNIVGLKTGNTEEAGGCFMAAAVKDVNGQKIVSVSVIMGAPYRNIALQDSIPLVNSVFDNFETASFVNNGEVVGTYAVPGSDSVSVTAKNALSGVKWKGSEITPEVTLNKIDGNVSRGAEVGTVKVQLGRQTLESPITVNKSIEQPSWETKLIPRSFW